MGLPSIAGWFIEKILLKWMITRGTPIYGTPHIFPTYAAINPPYSGLSRAAHRGAGFHLLHRVSWHRLHHQRIG